MPNQPYLGINGTEYSKATGAATDQNPRISEHSKAWFIGTASINVDTNLNTSPLIINTQDSNAVGLGMKAAYFNKLSVQIENTGNTSLSNFEVHVRVHPNGVFFSILNSPSKFTSPQSQPFTILSLPCLGEDGNTLNPNTLSPGNTAFLFFTLDKVQIEAIQFKARTGSGTTSLNFNWSGS